MKKSEKFLELYREYESVLRDQGIEYKELEDNSSDMIQNRMRICRQIRNYLTHNHDAGFLEVSDIQLAFISKLIEDQKMLGDVFKHHLCTVRMATCEPKDKCTVVLAKMAKLKSQFLPVYDGKEILGVVSVFDVSCMLAEKTKTVKISDVKMSKKKVLCFTPDTPMDDVLQYNDYIICCTDTGETTGKLLGVYVNNIDK